MQNLYIIFNVILYFSILIQSNAVDCIHAIALHKSGSSVLGHLLSQLYPKECFTEQSTTIDVTKYPNCPVIMNFYRDWEMGRERIFDKKCDTCKLYLQIRHPLDVMVSMYNSYTTNKHVLPPHFTKEQKRSEVLLRANEHAKGVDKYSISHFHYRWAIEVDFHLKLLEEARIKYKCEVYLSHYESFVSRTIEWSHIFQLFMSLTSEQNVLLKEWAIAQSNIVVNATKHTTYVYPGAYLKRLKPQTSSKIMQNITNYPYIVKYSGYF